MILKIRNLSLAHSLILLVIIIMSCMNVKISLIFKTMFLKLIRQVVIIFRDLILSLREMTEDDAKTIFEC